MVKAIVIVIVVVVVIAMVRVIVIVGAREIVIDLGNSLGAVPVGPQLLLGVGLLAMVGWARLPELFPLAFLLPPRPCSRSSCVAKKREMPLN